MLLCVCVMLLVASQMSFGLDKPSLDAQWEQWKNTYGKQYKDNAEEEDRRTIWEQNMHMIEVHNQETKQGKHSYKLGMNHLGDRMSEEMSVKMVYNRMSRYISKKIAGKMAEYNEASKNQMLQKMEDTMVLYDRTLRRIVSRKMNAEMGENYWISRYHVSEEMDKKMAEYNWILLNLISEEMSVKTAEYNWILTKHILEEMDKKMAQYQRVSRYHAKFSYYKDQSTCNHKGTQEFSEQCKGSGKNNITGSLPKSVDYRKKGLVTQVRNQGLCGSCWAFSAAGALEGQLAKNTGQLLNVSSQNLVDCVLENNGCAGGYPDLAFEYLQENGGMYTEEDYPYVGERQKCHHKPPAVVVQCKGFEWIPEGNEHVLAEALYEVGPLSVLINSGDKKFLFYKSGVYYNPDCIKDNPTHAMLLVGYGETAKGEKYWIVKNSWGEEWGDKGYIRIARNRDNHCGIASDASYPLI